MVMSSKKDSASLDVAKIFRTFQKPHPYVIIPYRFWETRLDTLADVRVSKVLDADTCVHLWEYLGYIDEPPQTMDVLVIYSADGDHPPEMLVG